MCVYMYGVCWQCVYIHVYACVYTREEGGRNVEKMSVERPLFHTSHARKASHYIIITSSNCHTSKQD